MYNGTMLVPELQYQKDVLRAKIEDAERYDGACIRHGADIDELLEKVNELTPAEVYILQEEIVRAWNNNKVDEMMAHLSHI